MLLERMRKFDHRTVTHQMLDMVKNLLEGVLANPKEEVGTKPSFTD
jgi:hypothetical protein